jgi:hypothetical protein
MAQTSLGVSFALRQRVRDLGERYDVSNAQALELALDALEFLEADDRRRKRKRLPGLRPPVAGGGAAPSVASAPGPPSVQVRFVGCEEHPGAGVVQARGMLFCAAPGCPRLARPAGGD